VSAAAARIRGLYAVTPDLADTARLAALVAAALEGGARVVQYRNKVATPGLKLEQARALKTACERHGALLIVNDDVDVAVAVDADGVHLGRDDDFGSDVRKRLGPGKLIGVSCYRSIERARAAVAEGADHVAFGGFYPSQVKPSATRAPIALLAEAKSALDVPVVAIGGITVENGGALIEAGADALAVITALFNAPDVAAAARQFSALFGSGDAKH
jgi:thiamine-phosphate pyrophosphorylase